MNDFAHKLIVWQKREGRHGLPWQGTRDPYQIWLSEIMLQQTQVSTAAPYYERFLARFPTVASLAGAVLDEVMQMWAGLGYYARARNLHKAAQLIVSQFGGVFPREFELVLSLPGIGRSTAAAICAFAYDESRPILDGNVKRVFVRYFAIDQNVSAAQTEKDLWKLAESLVPTEHIGTYIQAQMDLGATVCTRSNPRCLLCPLRADCVAFSAGRTDALPARRIAKRQAQRATQVMVMLAGDEVLLERRPPSGIWGGLWSLPEAAIGEDLVAIARARFHVVMRRGRRPEPLPLIEHGFTHFALTIQPALLRLSERRPHAAQSTVEWMSIAKAIECGVPSPIKKILQALSITD